MGKEILKMRKHSWSSESLPLKTNENTRFSKRHQNILGHRSHSGSCTPTLTYAQRANLIRRKTLTGVSYKRKGLPFEGLQNELLKAKAKDKIEVKELEKTVIGDQMSPKRAVSEQVTPKSRMSVENDNLEDSIFLPCTDNVTVKSLPSPRRDWDLSELLI